MTEPIKELDVVWIQATVLEDFGETIVVEISDGEGRGVAFPELPRSVVVAARDVA